MSISYTSHILILFSFVLISGSLKSIILEFYVLVGLASHEVNIKQKNISINQLLISTTILYPLMHNKTRFNPWMKSDDQIRIGKEDLET